MAQKQTETKIKLMEIEFANAMKQIIKNAGSQKNLAEQTGMHQSNISGYLNGSFIFSNLTIGTLIKLFPELQIKYFDSINEASNDTQEIFDMLEQRLITMFHRLNSEEKIRCFEIVARSFGEKYNL